MSAAVSLRRKSMYIKILIIIRVIMISVCKMISVCNLGKMIIIVGVISVMYYVHTEIIPDDQDE